MRTFDNLISAWYLLFIVLSLYSHFCPTHFPSCRARYHIHTTGSVSQQTGSGSYRRYFITIHAVPFQSSNLSSTSLSRGVHYFAVLLSMCGSSKLNSSRFNMPKAAPFSQALHTFAVSPIITLVV